MPDLDAAEKHLRVIRSLMEKATIYRAISAPTALMGGMAALAAAGLFHWKTATASGAAESANLNFLRCWLAALVIAAAGNLYFLRSDAARRGDRFFSAGMRAALRALWPSYLIAAVLTILWANSPHLLPVPWILLYALGLLGTQHFAPRSIVLLGWAFLVAGLAALVALAWLPQWPSGIAALAAGNLAMGITFGVFHLVYAACVWPRRSAAGEAVEAP